MNSSPADGRGQSGVDDELGHVPREALDAEEGGVGTLGGARGVEAHRVPIDVTVVEDTCN